MTVGGVESGEGGVPIEFTARSDERFVAEYLIVAQQLGLQEPLRIVNPACGPDTSLSGAFPESAIWYIDPDPRAIRALHAANLGPHAQIVQGSLMDVHPENIDLVVLRNAIIPGVNQQDVVNATTQTLKPGGIVIASHYAMADTAKAILEKKTFQLLGNLPSVATSRGVTFDQENIPQLSKSLRRDRSVPSQFGGVTFVFQKI